MFEKAGLKAGELKHLVVVVLNFETLAVGEKVEELEGRLLRIGDSIPESLIEKLFKEVVFAGAAALDLDEVSGREDGAEKAEVEDVGAILAGGHHAYSDADACPAGTVGRKEIGGPEEVVVTEVDGELLGIGDGRGDLDGEIGVVPAGEHVVGHEVEHLGELGGMHLADRVDDGLADLAADRIAQGILEKGPAEKLIGSIGEKTPFELALLEGLLAVLAGIIGEGDDEPLLGKEGGGDLGAGIHHGGADQVAIPDAV